MAQAYPNTNPDNLINSHPCNQGGPRPDDFDMAMLSKMVPHHLREAAQRRRLGLPDRALQRALVQPYSGAKTLLPQPATTFGHASHTVPQPSGSPRWKYPMFSDVLDDDILDREYAETSILGHPKLPDQEDATEERLEIGSAPAITRHAADNALVMNHDLGFVASNEHVNPGAPASLGLNDLGRLPVFAIDFSTLPIHPSPNDNVNLRSQIGKCPQVWQGRRFSGGFCQESPLVASVDELDYSGLNVDNPNTLEEWGPSVDPRHVLPDNHNRFLVTLGHIIPSALQTQLGKSAPRKRGRPKGSRNKHKFDRNGSPVGRPSKSLKRNGKASSLGKSSPGSSASATSVGSSPRTPPSSSPSTSVGSSAGNS
ncbi:hypothetical protein B0H67DRAFT_168737 [Lasiosphaeris hirsuta]|uniref:Uncharacterized protein n=1 Tax=Lasiosphaeris hirsuta TaxID=260670 RepID=A0AA40AQ34_9PEZI|nr:hypothetical protein B0H67DRAFT_168737 [Lasiosphaeris hirsuta]